MDRVLEVRGLSKRYGKGCPSCFDKTGPDYDSNICPDCGSVVAAQDVCFDLYTGESSASWANRAQVNPPQ